MKDYILVVILIILDQFLKYLFFSYNLEYLIFHKAKNYWIGLSIDIPYFLIIVNSFLFLVVLWFLLKNNVISKGSFLFIFAWWVSNLIDRILFGYVRDYIDFFNLFIFNLADFYITIGVLFLVYQLFRKKWLKLS